MDFALFLLLIVPLVLGAALANGQRAAQWKRASDLYDKGYRWTGWRWKKPES